MKKFNAFIAGLAVTFISMVLNPILDYMVVGPELSSTPSHTQARMSETFPADVEDYSGFTFIPRGVASEVENYLGLWFTICKQCAPRWLTYLLEPNFTLPSMPNNITIYDARTKGLSFNDTGFTLYKMPSPSTTVDWRDAVDVKKFHAEIEPAIRDLFPGLKRLEWTTNVVRGGHNFGDQPVAVDGPHLDYSQNDTAREIFHTQYASLGPEQGILLGKKDTEMERLHTLLGVWKPIHMDTPVCDHPLTVMDAGTFFPEDEWPVNLHMNFLVFMYHSLTGGIKYNPLQRWYYYSRQQQDEVLIFTQYTRGRHFANPHSSFSNPHCPSGSMPTRQSIEIRVGVFV